MSSLTQWRNLACLVLTFLLPVSLTAEDAAGVLHSNGGVLVNNNSVQPVWSLFPGDVIETLSGSPATIQLNGSSVEISPESVVEFRREELVLEHGGVFVGTSLAFRVRSGCVLVTPVNTSRTIYEVSNTDGKVTVFAQQRDVNVDSRGRNSQLSKTDSSNRATVREGERKSREEKCGAAELQPSATASPSLMNSPYVLGSAAAVVAGVTIWVLKCSDDPLSPSTPTAKC